VRVGDSSGLSAARSLGSGGKKTNLSKKKRGIEREREGVSETHKLEQLKNEKRTER